MPVAIIKEYKDNKRKWKHVGVGGYAYFYGVVGPIAEITKAEG